MKSQEGELAQGRSLVATLGLLAFVIGILWLTSFLSTPIAAGDNSDFNGECLETPIGYCSEAGFSSEGEGVLASGGIGNSGGEEESGRCLLPWIPCWGSNGPEGAWQSSESGIAEPLMMV